MKIALDVDGVLADHLAEFVDEHHERTGFEIAHEDLHTWDVPLPASEDETTLLEAVSQRSTDPAYLRRAPTIPGAVDGVRQLRDRGHEVVIATHRSEEIHSATRAWLDANGIPYDGYVSSVPANKGLVDADLLLDDYHGNVRNAIDEGMEGLLFVQPWNRMYAADFDARTLVRGWEQALDEIDRRCADGTES